MLQVIAFLFIGIIAGWLCRKWSAVQYSGVMVTVTVLVLLFLLGVEVGSNRTVLGNLAAICLQALGFALAAVLGASVAAWCLLRLAFKNEKASTSQDHGKRRTGMSGSISVVAVFAIGCIMGVSGIIPQWAYSSGVTRIVLYVLLFCVGIGIGSRKDLRDIIRNVSPGVLLIPVAGILGSLAFTALAGMLAPGRSLPESLAVGSGMAYYSLSSILIAECAAVPLGVQGASELAAIALLANVFRELLTLIGAPLLSRIFGPIAPITSGGATAMDVTLPAILRSSGNKWLAASVISGLVTDFSVPFLVTLFCSLI